LLRQQGEELNSHKVPGVPVVKYAAVNHRLDAGSTYAIELSSYQQIHAYNATLRVPVPDPRQNVPTAEIA